MEEAAKGWMMIWIGKWVNVSAGTSSPRYSWTKGSKMVVVHVVIVNIQAIVDVIF